MKRFVWLIVLALILFFYLPALALLYFNNLGMFWGIARFVGKRQCQSRMELGRSQSRGVSFRRAFFARRSLDFVVGDFSLR